MCGGGGHDPYDAYEAGDYARWQSAFDKKADIELAQARGEITPEEAEQQLAALTAGTQHTEMVPNPFLPGVMMPKTVGEPGINFDRLENKVKQDASANMELREYKRQHDIDLGRIGIDKSFAKFDDPYYDQYKADYTGYYYPQLDRQYGKAVDKMTAALAGRGMLESTAGASQFADLGRENAEARTNIANEAQDAANKLRSTVENEKSNLYSLNQASADPQAVNAQAVGQATALVAPPQYSPLGQVFANALGSIGNFVSAKQNTPTKSYVSPYPTGYGSGRVVS